MGDEAQNEQYGRKRGYTQDIFVRRPWRQRGLARSLPVQIIEMLRRRGFLSRMRMASVSPRS
jgi:GNAT superfamily N-acetyltransferase